MPVYRRSEAHARHIHLRGWNINDAITWDPVSFLTEVYEYSVLTGQDAVKELTKSLEPSMANAATAILDAARVCCV